MEMEKVKINSLSIENVKKVKAISFDLSEDGLTLIGGKNAQGKTTILDSIAFALGGGRKKPSNYKREGGVASPLIKVELSNGLIVERTGENGNLVITDSLNKKGGQALLDSFISELALDIPKFLNSNNKDKLKILLDILGIENQLKELDKKEADLSSERTLVGREVKTKKGAVDNSEFYENLPSVPLSASDLLELNKKILEKNAKNSMLRQNLSKIELEGKRISDLIKLKEDELKELKEKYASLKEDWQTAKKDASNLEDESTDKIQEKLKDIEEINSKIRKNLDRQVAIEEHELKQKEYDDLTLEIELTRQSRLKLLQGAKLPLPELGVEDGELTYKGKKWDCISGSEQLIVATSIVKNLKPECGFVLMDKLEQMDSDTLKNFNEWLISQDLQIIGTIVGDHNECQIIIEDGEVKENRSLIKPKTEKPKQEVKKEPKQESAWSFE